VRCGSYEIIFFFNLFAVLYRYLWERSYEIKNNSLVALYRYL
jgi:hypothetical protein